MNLCLNKTLKLSVSQIESISESISEGISQIFIHL